MFRSNAVFIYALGRFIESRPELGIRFDLKKLSKLFMQTGHGIEPDNINNFCTFQEAMVPIKLNQTSRHIQGQAKADRHHAGAYYAVAGKGNRD